MFMLFSIAPLITVVVVLPVGMVFKGSCYNKCSSERWTSKVAANRQVNRTVKRLQGIKIWQLLFLLMLTGFVAATFLRLNNIGMAQRREAVLAADKEAKDADVANRLYDLQRYTSAHMNASTGQFDLKYQYQRDVQKAINEAANTPSSQGNVHAMAEATCRERYPNYQAGTYLQYQQCFLDEIAKFPPSETPEDSFVPPSPALYRHSFASPLWSPDFAGFSLLVFLAIATVIVIRLVHLGLLYLLLNIRSRGISS
jgi:hypothetical protein